VPGGAIITSVQKLLKEQLFDIGNLALKDKSIVLELVSLLDSHDQKIREDAAFAIGRIAETKLKLVKPDIPKLIRRLIDPDESVRTQAAYAIMGIADKEPRLVEPAIPNLINLLNCSSEYDDIAAASALETVAERRPQLVKSAIPKLMKLLKHSDAHVRLVAIEEYVRLHALGVLEGISEAEVIQPLIRLIRDAGKVEVVRKELGEKGELKSPWFADANFVSTTVGEAAKEAVNKIKMANHKISPKV